MFKERKKLAIAFKKIYIYQDVFPFQKIPTMKLHLPVQLRRLLLVALICQQFEWGFAETQTWPYTEPTSAEVVIAPSEPGVDASVTISTWSEATYVDSIIFESGGSTP